MEMYACQTARERWKTDRGGLCVCLNCLFSRRANIQLGGSGERQLLHPRRTFLHLKQFLFPLHLPGGKEEAWREKPCVCSPLHPPPPAFNPGAHPLKPFFSCCEPLMDSFVLPATCNSLSRLLAEGYFASLGETAPLHRAHGSERFALQPSDSCEQHFPPPSTNTPLHPGLAHLLEAVGKVGASGAVFARLR